MPNAPAEDFLTATQVGTLIERSGRTVVRLAEAGEIAVAAKLPGPNGAHLFTRAEVDRFIAKRDAEKSEASR